MSRARDTKNCRPPSQNGPAPDLDREDRAVLAPVPGLEHDASPLRDLANAILKQGGGEVGVEVERGHPQQLVPGVPQALAGLAVHVQHAGCAPRAGRTRRQHGPRTSGTAARWPAASSARLSSVISTVPMKRIALPCVAHGHASRASSRTSHPSADPTSASNSRSGRTGGLAAPSTRSRSSGCTRGIVAAKSVAISERS